MCVFYYFSTQIATRHLRMIYLNLKGACWLYKECMKATDSPPRNCLCDSPPRNCLCDSPPRNCLCVSPPHNYLCDSPPHNCLCVSPPHNYLCDSPPHNYLCVSPPHNYLCVLAAVLPKMMNTEHRIFIVYE